MSPLPGVRCFVVGEGCGGASAPTRTALLVASGAMVTIRCTKKAARRIGAPAELTRPTTTKLGDWHAKPLAIGHQRLILLISEHSRLPVLMWARGVKQLAATSPTPWRCALGPRHRGRGNRPRARSHSRGRDRAGQRSLPARHPERLHSHAAVELPDRSDLDLVQAALELAHTPLRPLRPHHFPDQVTRELLGS